MGYRDMDPIKSVDTVFKKQSRPDCEVGKSSQQFGQSMMDVLASIGNQAMQNLVGSETAISETSTPSVSIQRLQRLESETTISESVESEDLAERLDKASHGGNTLDDNTRPQLERGLGAGLSGVRVHTDAEADRLTKEVNAVAFATGQHIFFGSGMYNPDSPEGLWLLAHESAHTLQQANGSVNGNEASEGVMLSESSDAFEQAADGAANRVLSGLSGAAFQAPSVNGGYISEQEGTSTMEQGYTDLAPTTALSVQNSGLLSNSSVFIQREEIPPGEYSEDYNLDYYFEKYGVPTFAGGGLLNSVLASNNAATGVVSTTAGIPSAAFVGAALAGGSLGNWAFQKIHSGPSTEELEIDPNTGDVSDTADYSGASFVPGEAYDPSDDSPWWDFID